jgi:hypothetical protein
VISASLYFEQRPVRMFCVRLVATVPNHVLRLVSVLDNVKFEGFFFISVANVPKYDLRLVSVLDNVPFECFFCIIVANVPKHRLRLFSVLDTVQFKGFFLRQRCTKGSFFPKHALVNNPPTLLARSSDPKPIRAEIH